MNDNIPIYFLSGMVADERLFRFQLEEFPQLKIIDWIEPEKNESLFSYAKRISGKIEKKDKPCFIGGASFGAIVALEITNHVDCLGCFVISSVSSPTQYPLRYKVFKLLTFLGIKQCIVLAKFTLHLPSLLLKGKYRKKLNGFISSKFIQWATFTLLRWNGKYHKTTKIFHIHGTNDRSFPLKLTTPDMSVKGGHIITLTNTNEVNNFIANKIKFSRIV